MQYIIDGKQSMTVFKDVRTLVKDAIGMAVALLEGTSPSTTGEYDNGAVVVPAKDIQVITVTTDKVQETIIDSGYYEVEIVDQY